MSYFKLECKHKTHLYSLKSVDMFTHYEKHSRQPTCNLRFLESHFIYRVPGKLHDKHDGRDCLAPRPLSVSPPLRHRNESIVGAWYKAPGDHIGASGAGWPRTPDYGLGINLKTD